MALTTKTALTSQNNSQITTNGVGDITGAILNGLIKNIIDSYEDFISSMDTATRDAIVSPADRRIIFNTDTNAYNYYSNTLAAWLNFGEGLFMEELIIKKSGNTDKFNPEAGDWRIYVNGDDLQSARYESGAWADKNTISTP